MRRLLLDNDVLLKLARYDLQDEFLRTCSGDLPHYVLPTAKYRFYLSNKRKGVAFAGSRDAFTRLKRLLATATEITEEPSPEVSVALLAVPGIDPGEALLYAIASLDPESLLLTGDKRSLAALGSSQAIPAVDSIKGRVKCFEQVVAELIQAHGAGVIVKLRGRPWDQAVSACVGSGNSPKEVLCGLESYYMDIQKRAGNILAPFVTSI
jgi:hypothetical protein